MNILRCYIIQKKHGYNGQRSPLDYEKAHQKMGYVCLGVLVAIQLPILQINQKLLLYPRFAMFLLLIFELLDCDHQASL